MLTDRCGPRAASESEVGNSGLLAQGVPLRKRKTHLSQPKLKKAAEIPTACREALDEVFRI